MYLGEKEIHRPDGGEVRPEVLVQEFEHEEQLLLGMDDVPESVAGGDEGDKREEKRARMSCNSASRGGKGGSRKQT